MFKLHAPYKPTGDQPNAIKSIIQGLKSNIKYQCLEGVTGSGKTFTVANVIESHNKPTLILCHNKTLAAQLYEEFKTFFPNNMVEYFVSYYDYYQPEAYLPATNTYIEKDLSINSEIEKFRLRPKNSEVNQLVCDNSKIINNTSWKPRINFEQGLLKTIDWFKKNSRFSKPAHYYV